MNPLAFLKAHQILADLNHLGAVALLEYEQLVAIQLVTADRPIIDENNFEC